MYKRQGLRFTLGLEDGGLTLGLGLEDGRLQSTILRADAEKQAAILKMCIRDRPYGCGTPLAGAALLIL